MTRLGAMTDCSSLSDYETNYVRVNEIIVDAFLSSYQDDFARRAEVVGNLRVCRPSPAVHGYFRSLPTHISEATLLKCALLLRLKMRLGRSLEPCSLHVRHTRFAHRWAPVPVQAPTRTQFRVRSSFRLSCFTACSPRTLNTDAVPRSSLESAAIAWAL